MRTSKEEKLELFLQMTTELEPIEIKCFLETVKNMKELVEHKKQIQELIELKQKEISDHKHRVLSEPELTDEDVKYLNHLTDLGQIA